MFKELAGSPVREHLENFIIKSVNDCKLQGINPKIAVIRAGEDSSQLYYEQAIVKAADAYGIEVQTINFDNNVSQFLVEVSLEAVNIDEDVHGVVMLRPFPSQIDEEPLRAALHPEKDIDAVTDISIAELFAGKEAFMACTAESCMEILAHYGIDVVGKKVTILGRSMTVGKPLAIMMLNNNATITICHSLTPREDLISACRNADIVVLATGRTEAFGSEFFRDGQIILDVGTGTGEDGKMHGDLNIEEIKSSGLITDLSYTPVPGGVGAVTTAILLRNVLKAVKLAK